MHHRTTITLLTTGYSISLCMAPQLVPCLLRRVGLLLQRRRVSLRVVVVPESLQPQEAALQELEEVVRLACPAKGIIQPHP